MIDWCRVPSGTLQAGARWRAVPEFAIGKYPVTNAQFGEFVEDGGYADKRHWTDPGWTWRTVESIDSPQFWLDGQWNIPNHPVVGVLWHEALAFCRWLSARTGEPVSLPTELQRERAARGDEGLDYPWGEMFDGRLCNSAESGIGRTTPVYRYPDGASPFGVVDLSGNVWEWCLDPWDPSGPAGTAFDEDAPRALRGGSFFDTSLSTLCEIRARYHSAERLPYVGFRVVRM